MSFYEDFDEEELEVRFEYSAGSRARPRTWPEEIAAALRERRDILWTTPPGYGGGCTKTITIE